MAHAPRTPVNQTDAQDNAIQPTSSSLSESTDAPSRLSRRFFLGASLGAAGTAAAALAPSSAAEASEMLSVQDNTTACSSTSPLTYRMVPFNPTNKVFAQNKVLSLPDLSVELGAFTYQCTGSSLKQVTARMFNQSVPGYSMILDPGDRIDLTITNYLPPNSVGTNDGQCPASKESEELMNHPSCFNTFNMHFHGLHVSPGSYCDDKNAEGQGIGQKVLSSDDVLYQLSPRANDGESAPSHNWCTWLPDYHAPGTHWYHAHRHGSTALQVSNGMAGAIIVREPKETQIVPANDDEIWVIQEIILPSQGMSQEEQDLAVYQRLGTTRGGTPGDFLVNGRFQPTISLKAGQLQRWRFINANSTPRGFTNLKLRKINSDPSAPPSSTDDLAATKGDLAPLWLIAVDGISFYGKPPTLIGRNTNAIKEPGLPITGCNGWDFAAGNRADFLVKLDAGWYKVIKDLPSSGVGGTAAQVLAYVKVDEALPGRPTDNIPTKVPGIPLDSPKNPYKRYLRPILDDDVMGEDGKITERQIEFSRQRPVGPEKYFINKGIPFEDNTGLYNSKCSDVTVNLGACEQWELHTLPNTPQPLGGGAGHPFHIHVNPFQVVGDKIDPCGPNDATNWRFWDTIAIPAGSTTKIRSYFADYTGTYVFHCHILIHEDQGMMKNVTVRDMQTMDFSDRMSGSIPRGVGVPPCASLNKKGKYEIGDEAKAILKAGGAECKYLDPCDPPTVPEQKVDPDPDPPVISCTEATCPEPVDPAV